MGLLLEKIHAPNQQEKQQNIIPPKKPNEHKRLSFSSDISDNKYSLANDEKISTRDFYKIVYSNTLVEQMKNSDNPNLRTNSELNLNSIQEKKPPNAWIKRKSCFDNFSFKKRKIGIVNFNDNNNSNLKNNILNKNNLRQSLMKYVTHEDIYFESEMFMVAPSSYPGDYEKSKISSLIEEENEITINGNIEINLDDVKSDDNDEILNNSFSYKDTHDDKLHLDYFIRPEKNNINNNNDKLNENNKINIIEKKLDSTFVDEEEVEGENISFITGISESQLKSYNTKFIS